MSVDEEADLVAAATALRERHGFGAVLVTRSEDGMTLVDDEGAHHFPAEAAEVFDVSGAGDTVVATLAAGLAAGLDTKVAVRLANIAAGVVVGKVGTAVAREEDLLADADAAGQHPAQDRHPRGRDRAGRALAPQGLAHRLHQRLSSTCCTPGTCTCSNRPAASATGSWSASTRTRACAA